MQNCREGGLIPEKMCGAISSMDLNIHTKIDIFIEWTTEKPSKHQLDTEPIQEEMRNIKGCVKRWPKYIDAQLI